jgi:hypothetical protein
MLINVGHSGGNFMFDNRHRYTLRGGREKRNFIELIKKKTKPETRNQASSEKSFTCMSLLHHLVVYQWLELEFVFYIYPELTLLFESTRLDRTCPL